MADKIDWLHAALGVIALVWMIVGPIVLRRNARLAKIINAVVEGVESADHGPTKDAITVAAVEAGVASHLDAIVQAAKAP